MIRDEASVSTAISLCPSECHTFSNCGTISGRASKRGADNAQLNRISEKPGRIEHKSCIVRETRASNDQSPPPGKEALVFNKRRESDF
jgi:hypothetical protein